MLLCWLILLANYFHGVVLGIMGFTCTKGKNLKKISCETCFYFGCQNVITNNDHYISDEKSLSNQGTRKILASLKNAMLLGQT